MWKNAPLVVAHVPTAVERSFLQIAQSINPLPTRQEHSPFGSANDVAMKKWASANSPLRNPSIEMIATELMSKELRLLNLICVVAAIGFLAMIVVSALSSGDILSVDNLFITAVCLVLALVFAVNPLLYLKSEGKLPIPFLKKSSADKPRVAAGSSAPRISPASPPLLDAKGRAVPPDVKAIVSHLGQTQTKDA